MRWCCKMHIPGFLPCKYTKMHIVCICKGAWNYSWTVHIMIQLETESKQCCLRFCLNSETKPSRPFGLDLKEEHFNNHRAWQKVAVCAHDNNSFIRQALCDWLKDSIASLSIHRSRRWSHYWHAHYWLGFKLEYWYCRTH